MTDTRAVRSRSMSSSVRGSAATVGDDGVPVRMTDMDVATELLIRATDAVLVGHVHPDADALGSALALGLGLERRGVPVAVSFAEPGEIPASLRLLPGGHLVVPADGVPDHPDLLVSLDVGSAARLGSLDRLLTTARQSLIIDHHPSNTRFGDHHLIDPSAGATVVLVARLLDRLGVPIDLPIAKNLYAGLATDTGHFRHADSDAHRLAARLIDTGVRPAEVLRPITDSHPFGWLTMLSQVLGRAVLHHGAADGRGVVCTTIDLATSTGLRSEELDSVIDILRTVQEAAVAVVLKQTAPGTWQVSLRSHPPVDVAALATELGGGGHVRAAGFTHHGNPDDAIAAILTTLQR